MTSFLNNIGPSGTNPVTPTGKVVVNAHTSHNAILERMNNETNLVPQYQKAIPQAAYFVQDGHLVFQVDDSLSNVRSMSPDLIPVMSVLNNISTTGGSLQELYDVIHVVGIAMPPKASIELTSQQNLVNVPFPVCIGGMKTIKNNGTRPINNGDRVMWALPFEDDGASNVYGKRRLPDSSEVFTLIVEPYHEDDIQKKALRICQTELDNLTANWGPNNTDLKTYQKKSINIYHKAFKTINKAQSRIIGIARSGGQPGTDIDIQLT